MASCRSTSALEHALFDDRKLGSGAADAVIVKANRCQPSLLRAIRHYRHEGGAELQLVQFLWRHQGSSGKISLPSERAVKLGRVPDRFVQGQPKIGRVDYEIVSARRHGSGLQLLSCLLGRKSGLRYKIAGVDIFPARPARRSQTGSTGECARLLVYGGDLELGMASHPCLRDVAALR